MSAREEDFSKTSVKFGVVMTAAILTWLLACFAWGAANAVDIRAARRVSAFFDGLSQKREELARKAEGPREVREILDLLANERYKEAVVRLKRADIASPYLRAVLSDEEISALGLENVELGSLTETLKKSEANFLQVLQLYSSELGLHSTDETREMLRRYEAAKEKGDPLASLKLAYELADSGVERSYPDDAKEFARRAIEEARRIYTQYGEYVF